MPKPILKKPAGPSKFGQYAGIYWNNSSWGSDGPILCEICGTTHPENKEQSYIVSRFLGLQVVEDCCGGILDMVYQESAEVFALKLLDEFAENPTDFRFRIFLDSIKDAVNKVAKKLAEVSETVGEISRAVNTIGG